MQNEKNNIVMHFLNSTTKMMYFFTGLSLSTLSLSIQFSPNMGKSNVEFLILAWILFLLSTIVNVIIIRQLNSFIYNNLNYYDWTKKKSDIDKNLIRVGEDTKKTINEKVNKLKKKLPKQEKLRYFLISFSSGIYLLGLIFNGIFIVLNYLK